MPVFSKALVGRFLHENTDVEVVGGVITKVIPGLDTYDISGVLVPGFVDAHAHFISYALSLNRPRLDGISDPDEVLKFVAAKAPRVDREVVIMEGYDDTLWRRPLTRRDLDRITDRPLILRRICGHKAVLNSAAVRWLKERHGPIEGLDEETGLAVEHLPLNLSRYVPPSDREVETAILTAENLASRLGIVALGENAKAQYVRKLVEMDGEGRINLRWRVAVYYSELGEISDLLNYTSERVRIVGVKEFLDGSVGARTAAFSFPYGDSGGRAPLLHDDDYLRGIIEAAESRGLGVWFHAIGDRAIEQALRVISEAGDPTRHRIEHFLFPRNEHYRWAATLQVGIAVQPNFTRRWGRLGGLYHKVIGDAIYWHNRFRTMENLGVRYAFSSDNMPPGPIYGISGALRHPVREERLSLAEALYRYTGAGARLLGDDTYGEIEVGKQALLSVFCEECVERG
ncbi:MAG: amidohydrolase family protein [Thermotogae bacterium]|nr:amidohydrolase family protein [Thermotogota bacterium]